MSTRPALRLMSGALAFFTSKHAGNAVNGTRIRRVRSSTQRPSSAIAAPCCDSSVGPKPGVWKLNAPHQYFFWQDQELYNCKRPFQRYHVYLLAPRDRPAPGTPAGLHPPLGQALLRGNRNRHRYGRECTRPSCSVEPGGEVNPKPKST